MALEGRRISDLQAVCLDDYRQRGAARTPPLVDASASHFPPRTHGMFLRGLPRRDDGPGNRARSRAGRDRSPATPGRHVRSAARIPGATRACCLDDRPTPTSRRCSSGHGQRRVRGRQRAPSKPVIQLPRARVARDRRDLYSKARRGAKRSWARRRRQRHDRDAAGSVSLEWTRTASGHQQDSCVAPGSRDHRSGFTQRSPSNRPKSLSFECTSPLISMAWAAICTSVVRSAPAPSCRSSRSAVST